MFKIVFVIVILGHLYTLQCSRLEFGQPPQEITLK